MITNQIMKRQLANYIVEQRTKDGMFNATALLKQWNEVTVNRRLLHIILKILQHKSL